MEKILDLVRSNNLVQAVLCIAFGLFLMIYPSITIQGIIMLFGVALALMGAAGLVSYFRQKSVRYRNTGTLMGAVFYLIIALIAFVFPKVIAGFFSVVLGVVLILFAIVNVVRALGLRAFGGSIWIAVLVAAVIVFAPAGILPAGVALPALAFAGSLITALIGWRLSVVRGTSSPKRLLLIGVALATGLSSVTSLLMLRMGDGDYAFVQNWLAGSIWGATWPNVAMLAVGLGALVAIALFAARTLNVLALGEAAATGLGVNVRRASAGLLAVAVGCSGLCCAVGGGLTFVGLVCPHLARRLVGPNFRVLIPATVLVGAVLMLAADIVSRTLLMPNEIPVGIVAAVIGAPYFLYLLAKS